MKENEFDLIHLTIKSRLNKQVKELKKLYQATVGGHGAINFHSKCDNIHNTLVLYKSPGYRRFGGFTSSQWKSTEEGQFQDDSNAFLFSLDKKKFILIKTIKMLFIIIKTVDQFLVVHITKLDSIFRKNVFDRYDIHIGERVIQQKNLYIY